MAFLSIIRRWHKREHVPIREISRRLADGTLRSVSVGYRVHRYQPITAGARVFWDDSNRRITTTATGNYQVGIAVLASATADATVRVWLQRAPASGA